MPILIYSCTRDPQKEVSIAITNGSTNLSARDSLARVAFVYLRARGTNTSEVPSYRLSQPFNSNYSKLKTLLTPSLHINLEDSLN